MIAAARIAAYPLLGANLEETLTGDQNFARLRWCYEVGWPVYITRKIIPLDCATAMRDHAPGNLDEAELWAQLNALGYDSSEVEWHISNPGRRMEQGVANGR